MEHKDEGTAMENSLDCAAAGRDQERQQGEQQDAVTRAYDGMGLGMCSLRTMQRNNSPRKLGHMMTKPGFLTAWQLPEYGDFAGAVAAFFFSLVFFVLQALSSSSSSSSSPSAIFKHSI